MGNHTLGWEEGSWSRGLSGVWLGEKKWVVVLEGGGKYSCGGFKGASACVEAARYTLSRRMWGGMSVLVLTMLWSMSVGRTSYLQNKETLCVVQYGWVHVISIDIGWNVYLECVKWSYSHGQVLKVREKHFSFGVLWPTSFCCFRTYTDKMKTLYCYRYSIGSASLERL